ncbi:MAG: hypothetical protein V2A79_11220 [Planctomycetota bacterium]
MTKSQSQQNVTVFDGASLHAAVEVLSERLGRRLTIDYPKLKLRADEVRASAGWQPATISAILLSIDPDSEGQQRFQTMLRHAGFEPDLSHYRDAFVSLPPGRSPNEASGKSIVSFAARIAYIAGLMVRHPEPHVLVVSHSFELCGPLSDLAHRIPSAKVGIAYFASLIDFRWKAAGLLDGKSPVTFFDLDAHGKELLGVNLTGGSGVLLDAKGGLSRF